MRELGVLQFSGAHSRRPKRAGAGAATLARRSGDSATVVRSLTVIGNAPYFRGRFGQARPFFEQTLLPVNVGAGPMCGFIASSDYS